MKIPVLIFAGLSIAHFSMGQLKTTPVCPPFEVDILAGSVNEITPKSNWTEIGAAFPCFSEIVEKDSGSKCAGVFYKDKGIYFFTDRDYIELKENFKGKSSPKLMGTTRSSLFNTLGYPKIKDITWDAFQTRYGTLILYYNKANKIIKIQMSTKTTDAIKLCE